MSHVFNQFSWNKDPVKRSVTARFGPVNRSIPMVADSVCFNAPNWCWNFQAKKVNSGFADDYSGKFGVVRLVQFLVPDIADADDQQ